MIYHYQIDGLLDIWFILITYYTYGFGIYRRKKRGKEWHNSSWQRWAELGFSDNIRWIWFHTFFVCLSFIFWELRIESTKKLPWTLWGNKPASSESKLPNSNRFALTSLQVCLFMCSHFKYRVSLLKFAYGYPKFPKFGDHFWRFSSSFVVLKCNWKWGVVWLMLWLFLSGDAHFLKQDVELLFPWLCLAHSCGSTNHSVLLV